MDNRESRQVKLRLANAALDAAVHAIGQELGKHIEVITNEPLMRQVRVRLEGEASPRYYLIRFSEPI